MLWCKTSDGTAQNQTCQDQGPLTLERSKTVDEEISAKEFPPLQDAASYNLDQVMEELKKAPTHGSQ